MKPEKNKVDLHPVGSFDEAFASRIHVHLHYGDLEDEGRTTIWNNLFEKLQSEKDDVMILYEAKEYVRHDSALQALKWNGRQIRNGRYRCGWPPPTVLTWRSWNSVPDCCFSRGVRCIRSASDERPMQVLQENRPCLRELPDQVPRETWKDGVSEATALGDGHQYVKTLQRLLGEYEDGR